MTAPSILIVEDELVVALELEDRLRRQGYEVVGTARSAADALGWAERTQVDLALLDVRLGGARDGIDLAGDLRARGIPAVFLTAHGDEDTLHRIKAVEAQGYLLKPFDGRLLRLTIETALHRHAAERARLEAERARRRAEAVQATILEHSPDAMLVLGEGDRVELFNRAARDMFDLVGGVRHLPELGELLPELPELAPRVRGSTPLRTWARRGQDGRVPVELTAGLVPLEDAERVILIVRDISAQLRLERELAQARQLEIAGRLAAGLAHDLNNLLSTIATTSYLLDGAAGQEHAALLGELREAVEYGAALTTRLLTVGRRPPGRARRLAINEALRGIERLVRRTAGSEVELRLELDERAGLVFMDPTQLEQLVLNLASNADRAMPEGGVLTIRSSPVMTDDARGLVRIDVEDTGVGMDEELQRRVFEPFFTTRAELGGTGLGLAIVKDIVERAGGSLVLESQPGEGTRVRVVLPRVGGEHGLAVVERPEMASDNEPVSCSGVKDELAQHGPAERSLG
jgi:signal transduction histidine kinase